MEESDFAKRYATELRAAGLKAIFHALREAAQREIRLYSTHSLSEALAACRAVTAKYATIFDDVGKHHKGAP